MISVQPILDNFSLDTPTARPDLSERAYLLTVPSPTTVKSLSSPFEHALDRIGVVFLAYLVEQASCCQLRGDLAQAEALACFGIGPPQPLGHGLGLFELLFELGSRLFVCLCQPLNAGFAPFALSRLTALALASLFQLGDK